MNKSLKLTLAFASVATCSAQASSGAARPEKPNVLLILTDDLGWQDVKCYDIDEPSPYETPNLDKFSTESVMFWQAYSPAPTSAPSRGAIISGKHPARLQRTHVIGGTPVSVAGNLKGEVTLSPWYSARLIEDQHTLPKFLQAEGYTTGHAGKWHLSKTYPQAEDLGFDFSTSERGVTENMKPNRLSDFATTASDDPYQMDENGFPRDQNNLDALAFLDAHKDKPFFLYYATWLVHAPIQTRAKWLLEKYSKKMGIPVPDESTQLITPGQTNPFHGAMVEMMDYYVGQVLDYLRNTDDPRWPGHKLVENTYVIFTSDNGGMLGTPGKEIFTSNVPLDKGKIYVQEGGTRVPLFISGPGIPKGVQTNVLANGMDFLPTIMSWTKTQIPSDVILDGADLSTLLSQNPNDASLVKEQNGQVRNTMMHHFPHARMHSTLREGGYKLIHNFSPNAVQPLELYQLYDENNNRVDIEESKNLATVMPQKAKAMDKILMSRLESMDASLPYNNPDATYFEAQTADFGQFTSEGQDGNKVWAEYKVNKNKLVRAYVLYTLESDKAKSKEWFRMDAEIKDGCRIEAQMPEGTINYIFGVIDDKNFWFNYPDLGETGNPRGGGTNYAAKALLLK